MKKILCWALCVATLAGCELQTKREQALSAENDVLTTELTEKNQALEQAVQAIAQIQEGLLAINEAEGRVSIQSQGGEGLTDTERLKEDLLFIQKKMEDSRKQIEDLQKQLKASGTESASLRKVIANLQKELSDKTERIVALQAQLAEKDVRIAELDNAVTMLTEDVNTLHQVSEAQQEVIEQQVVQLNTAWYVYGTAKELKEQNILRSGDVMLSSDFNHNYFTEIDVRVDRVFPLYSKHAQLLTTHPNGSYEFTKGPDKQLTLNILDFESFWSVSRYMVIKVR